MSTEVVVGGAAIEACAVRAVLTVRSTLRVLRGTGVLAAAADSVRTGDAAVRLLVSADALDGPRISPELWAQRRAADRVRFLRGSHASLVIVDDQLALLPADSPSSGPACLCVTGQGLVRAMSQLFDALWDCSWELTPGATSTEGLLLDDQDRQLLALVIAGIKDGSIARQLGMGSRTVQRRISAMSQRMGARNRLELVRTAIELGLA
jgi:DNA-binding CsgD family transcriptional regulator